MRGRFREEHGHIERFMRRYKSAADMLRMGIFPDAKEITESVGAYLAVERHVNKRPSNPHTIVAVGDGNTPRTAALCAFWSRWECISIDPRMKKIKWAIDRLHVVRAKVEMAPRVIEGDMSIMAVHSHATLSATLSATKCTGNRSLVWMPCCVRENPLKCADHEYDDMGIWSPMRRIHVWKSV